MFSVGQKVELVGWGTHEAVSSWLKIGANYPEVGGTYTIRAIKPWMDSAVLLLAEVYNDHLGLDPEPGFRQEFFRPIVERKTDISFAHEILRKATKQADIGASA